MKHANVAIFVPHAGCPNRCSFCDQHTISGTPNAPDAETVKKICEAGLKNLGEQSKQAQIAFFGGSFTAVPEEYQNELLRAAFSYVGEDGYSGIRISTRPDCIEKETLSRLKSFKVTAVELGCQSMCDEVLQKNRRGHTAADVERACLLIKEAGLELGCQMMLGLWGDDREGAWKTARALAGFHPETMRIYPTIVLPKTMLEQLYRTGEYCPLSLDEAVSLGAELLSFFEDQKIRVIRMGLHDSETLSRERVAGPYHPAYRELCENQLFLNKMKAFLSEHGEEKKEWSVFVAPQSVSKAIGQKRKNLLTLKEMGFSVSVHTQEGLDVYGLYWE